MAKFYQQIRRTLIRKGLWDVLPYLIFGVLTTVVNIVVFAATYRFLHWSWPLSNSLAWLLSVLFAFVTNKLWVFHTHSSSWQALLWEFVKFIVARIASYGVDMATMYICIDLAGISDFIAKLISQVLVVVINYFLSKLIIFNHGKEK